MTISSEDKHFNVRIVYDKYKKSYYQSDVLQVN